MNWERVESDVRPAKFDFSSSKVYNYVRQNIVEKTREDEMSGETLTYFEFEELKVPKADWSIYEGMTDNAANIDYIAMMSDIEL